MIGYKATDKNGECRGFKFKVGKTYTKNTPKEELEKEAREYLAEHSEYSEVFGEFFVAVDTLTAMLDFAEPREKQIQIDAEQIRALQKQNGELTDELKALQESIKEYGAGCYENGLRNGRRKLEEQIEKMKCCSNCKYFYCPTASKVEKDGKVLFHNWNKEKQSYCDCGNGEGKKYQLWEIKEK